MGSAKPFIEKMGWDVQQETPPQGWDIQQETPPQCWDIQQETPLQSWMSSRKHLHRVGYLA